MHRENQESKVECHRVMQSKIPPNRLRDSETEGLRESELVPNPAIIEI